MEELNPIVKVEIEPQPQPMPTSDIQSMATNATRFVNYRITTRNAFYNNDSERTTRTLLIPEPNQDTDRLRSTMHSNFGRNRAVTARTARTSQFNEGEDYNDEYDNELEPPTVQMADLGMQSNGFSAYGIPPGGSIAKYKMIKDPESIGDQTLLEQESLNQLNLNTLIFFFCCVILLCLACGIACYVSFTITNDAALAIFVMLIVAIPLDMFCFRILCCLVITLILRCTARRKGCQKSVRLTGKTSRLAHKMIQDMMLGTLERNRVKDLEEDSDNDSNSDDEAKKPVNARPSKLSAKSKGLIEHFIKSRIGGKQIEKFEEEEDDIKKNPNKYNIFEERLPTESDAGASTDRRAVRSPPGKDEIELDPQNTKSINEDMNPENQSGENNEGGQDYDEEDDQQIDDMPDTGQIIFKDEYNNDGDKPSMKEKTSLSNGRKKLDENDDIAKPSKQKSKSDSYSHLLGEKHSKLEHKESMYEDYSSKNKMKMKIYPSVLNETMELNLLLLEKIFISFKKKGDRIVDNFRKDNFAHLRPKVLDIIEMPPDEFLNKKQSNSLDEIEEEEAHGDGAGINNNEPSEPVEINDETVLIGKDSNIEETYDEDEDLAYISKLHESDRDFDERFREEIDKEGMAVGEGKDRMLEEEEERRRREMLKGMMIYGDGSVHSHQSSTILDGREIEFQQPNIAMVDNNSSEESLEEQDIVYYHKDDTTQFSKHLNLNRVRRRDGNPLKLSEEDMSDDFSNRSNLMPDPLFRSALSEIDDDPSAFADLEASELDEDGLGGRGRGRGKATAGMIGAAAGLGALGAAKSKRRRKGKKHKLTDYQRRKLQQYKDIYGQDASELGLATRDERHKFDRDGKSLPKGTRDGNRSALAMAGENGLSTVGGKRKRKIKKRTPGDGNQSMDGARARFNALQLNKPKNPEGEYDKLKRKLQKFRKRKDLAFWMDYESPYAEYLPNRFREWVPKTKLGIILDTNKEADAQNEKAHELSRIYSRGISPGDETHEDFDTASKKGNKSKLQFYSGSKPSSSGFRPKSNSSMNAEFLNPNSSNLKNRGSSRKKSNSSKMVGGSRPPQHLSIDNNFLQPSDIFLQKESQDALMEGSSRSKNDFNIGPLYDNHVAEDIDYSKGHEDEEIDFRPIQFNKSFGD